MSHTNVYIWWLRCYDVCIWRLQPVKGSLILANAFVLISMLNAVSHTRVSRFGRVRKGQSCLLNISYRNIHIYKKNTEKTWWSMKKVGTDTYAVYMIGTRLIKKKKREEPLTSCSWVVRASAILKPPQRRNGRANQPLAHLSRPRPCVFASLLCK